jgi:hypothetical protein
MGLFGEKCLRCGKRRTKHTFDGVPTCEACELEIRTWSDAAKEGVQTCPNDGADMVKDVVLNVVIDRCPSCNSVWLDGGELELIRTAVANGVALDLARAVTLPI